MRRKCPKDCCYPCQYIIKEKIVEAVAVVAVLSEMSLLLLLRGLGATAITPITTTTQNISITSYTNSDPRIIMSRNNITISEAGAYNLDFRGLIEKIHSEHSYLQHYQYSHIE